MTTAAKYTISPLKSGFQKIQPPMVRRWLHDELEPVNRLKNLGHPDHCLFATNPKPENIRCRRNSEDTRRRSSASSKPARPLRLTAAALAVERNSRTPRVANVRYEPEKKRIRWFSLEPEGAQTQATLEAAGEVFSRGLTSVT